ncbi:type II toxin-antitoxin system RelE/ParE family toxin [Streptomyces sp. NPDC015032]
MSRPGRRRLRVGGCRVVRTIDNGEPVVRAVSIGHRSIVDDT